VRAACWTSRQTDSMIAPSSGVTVKERAT